MTQDFAKMRPQILVEKKPVNRSAAWSMLLAGVVLGLVIGVAACLVLYWSGIVPPVPQTALVRNAGSDPDTSGSTKSGDGNAAADTNPAPDAGEPTLQLEFYTELQNYEVEVDATPVDLSSEDPERSLAKPVVLQAGAFRRRALAETEATRQQRLGLPATVKQQDSSRGTMYLVQSGPYTTRGELDRAQQILRRNAIPSLRKTVQ